MSFSNALPGSPSGKVTISSSVISIRSSFLYSPQRFAIRRADIRAEAEDNVRRLRNHPSLVLWCGNNEIDVAWKPHDKRNSRFRKFYTEEEAEQFDRVNETIFRNILPGVVDSLCGGTVPYWHSSPSPGWGLDTADRWRYGDVHNWDVWHKGDPISAYNTQIARFISEYGLQSYPELSSVERFIPEGERRLASPSMTSHQATGKRETPGCWNMSIGHTCAATISHARCTSAN